MTHECTMLATETMLYKISQTISPLPIDNMAMVIALMITFMLI